MGNFKEIYRFKTQNYFPQQNQNTNKHSTVKKIWKQKTIWKLWVQRELSWRSVCWSALNTRGSG